MDLEKAMAPHSSTLAWKIPWTEEPSRLQSMGSLRVRHDWTTSLSLFTFMHWRRKRQPTPVFLPGEYQGGGEPGGLPSMGSHRVKHDWSDLAAAAAGLNYHDVEWFALETNRDHHSVIFEIASKYCISDSFVDHKGYSISSKGFLPTIVDIMVIWVKVTHSSPFEFADS